VHLTDTPTDGVVRVRASNPSALTLEGTNTYVVAGWVIDPGPDDPLHVEAVADAAGEDIEGMLFTHSHADHTAAAARLSQRLGGVCAELPKAGRRGPFRVLCTPGHTADHVCLLYEGTAFTGDTVLGRGSVFLSPGGGSLSAYLDSLEALRQADLRTLCPGHGPIVYDPAAKIEELINHRLDRERKLVAALEAGHRASEALLDAAWGDVPTQLRPAASLTLLAHLEKLKDEGRLPTDLEVPDLHS
jgi:glyoxylase-like metal-dependent hydrolase (beta-lactamase superfamily II)